MASTQDYKSQLKEERKSQHLRHIIFDSKFLSSYREITAFNGGSFGIRCRVKLKTCFESLFEAMCSLFMGSERSWSKKFWKFQILSSQELRIAPEWHTPWLTYSNCGQFCRSWLLFEASKPKFWLEFLFIPFSCQFYTILYQAYSRTPNICCNPKVSWPESFLSLTSA